MEGKVSTTESGGRKHHRAEAQEMEKLTPSEQHLQDGVEGLEYQKSGEWGIRGTPTRQTDSGSRDSLTQMTSS